jgi:MFS family permease
MDPAQTAPAPGRSDPTRGTSRAAPGLFRNRNFRLFFFGQLVSNTGNWLQLAAQAVLVKQLSGSSFAVGATTAALFLPVWFLALPGGSLADRFDRRRLLLAMQWLAMAATAALALLAATEHVTVAAVVIVALLVGVQFAVSIPTMMALLPSLVEPEQLGQVIGLNSITYNVARALGPAIATGIIAAIGFGPTFALNALSFVALIGALIAIRLPRDAGPASAGRETALGTGAIREALLYVWSHPRLRVMVLGVASVAVAIAPVVTLAPAFAADEFGARTADAGLLISGYGLGAIAGAVALTRAFRSHGRARFELLVPAGLLLAGGLVGFAFAPSMALGATALFVAGLGFIGSTVTWTTGVQQEVPDEIRGRIMGIWTLAFLGTWPLVAPLAGGIADLVNPQVAVLVMIAPLLLLVVFGVPVVRRRTVPG